MTKRVTRNIDPLEARDLLERVPRACLAFATDEGPCVVPVTAVVENQRYLVGARADGAHPAEGDEVVLLIDEGLHFFELRAVYVRGSVGAALRPERLSSALTWLEVEPTKLVAWDYGRLRNVDEP